ncbi:cyclic nucleotide-binding domain-containing protein [Chitinispirillales bacterium ANBcel5]|uniref:Crp/Fnr family transcriptional regulator n=1 Tax=Cellulosispirillum alkaliphilum TaxID=3039283 RepID=UPI002A588994|nr:cyclic nucleotide-binding domain-containing protein [Chitinispirillales bacterium ANBcel5]
MYSEKKTAADTILPVLKDVTIFAGLSKEAICSIYDSCDIVEACIGEVLLKEGAPATDIFILLRGRVSMVLNTAGQSLEIGDFGPGNCIGEASVIGIQNHSASAVVMEDATLLVLSRKLLMDLFQSDLNLFSLLILNIAREIARRLHHSDEILLHYGQRMRQE